MINFIDYFYNMKIENVKNNNKYYSFLYSGYLYKLYNIDNKIDINLVIGINRQMIKNTLVDKIIINKYGSYISTTSNNSYILVKVYSYYDKVTINDITFLVNSLYTNKIERNWGMLWSKKIDYLEDLINQFGKQYPLIVDSFNYYVGMCENAISYYNSIKIDYNYTYYIAHKVLREDDMVDSLYNPLNIIFDYKVRDVAEYIKKAFFLKSNNIMMEIRNYLNNNILSVTDIKLLVSRLLYPSFYFEMYEDILVDKKDEKILINYTNKTCEYEHYLAEIISYLHKYFDIDEILWLKEK